MAKTVKTTTGTIHLAFFLLKVCNMPLGLIWPTTITFEDLYASVQSLKGGYSAFLHVLQTLQSQLTPWLAAVQANPASFSILSFSLLQIHPAGFPALSTGTYPDTVLDTQAFSLLVEMFNGFLLPLTCELVLATGSVEAQQVLSTFLSQGESAITSASYFGAAIPGRFCPSFLYHFTVANRWPTCLNLLKDLIKAPFLLERALDFDPLVIDLYIANHPQLQLITTDQKSAEMRTRVAHSNAPTLIFCNQAALTQALLSRNRLRKHTQGRHAQHTSSRISLPLPPLSLTHQQ
jgi:hypothetical protein